MLISLGRWRDERKEKSKRGGGVGGTLAVNGPYLSLSLTLSVCCLYYSRLMGAEVIVPGVNWAENEVVFGGRLSRVLGGGRRWGWSGWIRARRHYSETHD